MKTGNGTVYFSQFVSGANCSTTDDSAQYLDELSENVLYVFVEIIFNKSVQFNSFLISLTLMLDIVTQLEVISINKLFLW